MKIQQNHKVAPAAVEASWKAPRIKTYLRTVDRPSTLPNSLPCFLVLYDLSVFRQKN